MFSIQEQEEFDYDPWVEYYEVLRQEAHDPQEAIYAWEEDYDPEWEEQLTQDRFDSREPLEDYVDTDYPPF